MANRRRGEIAAIIAGETYTLCLTLGALAELEDTFAVDDLAALGARFGSGRLSAEDLVKLIGAGLRGGGNQMPDAAIRAWPGTCLPEIASADAELLAATFGEPAANPTSPQAA